MKASRHWLYERSVGSDVRHTRTTRQYSSRRGYACRKTPWVACKQKLRAWARSQPRAWQNYCCITSVSSSAAGVNPPAFDALFSKRARNRFDDVLRLQARVEAQVRVPEGALGQECTKKMHGLIRKSMGFKRYPKHGRFHLAHFASLNLAQRRLTSSECLQKIDTPRVLPRTTTGALTVFSVCGLHMRSRPVRFLAPCSSSLS